MKIYKKDVFTRPIALFADEKMLFIIHAAV
jgi:hypothetical protein